MTLVLQGSALKLHPKAEMPEFPSLLRLLETHREEIQKSIVSVARLGSYTKCGKVDAFATPSVPLARVS